MSIYVDLWTDSNYQGGRLEIILSEYTCLDLSTIGFNNTFSSLKIYGINTLLRLYKDVNLGGDNHWFRGPIEVPTLSPYGLNDNVSSLSIFQIVDPPGHQGQGNAFIFKDSNLLGYSTYFPSGTLAENLSTFDGINGPFPNDSLSSLRLLPNTKITLYKDINFGGAQNVYANTSLTNLLDFNSVISNDTCSSLKVEYAI